MTLRSIILNGQITEREHGENYTIFIGDKCALAEIDDTFETHTPVYMCWVIGPKSITKELALEAQVNTQIGELDIKYDAHYSDVTGYLWTDEDFKFGGHDMFVFLENNINKYIFLVISTEPIDLAEL